MKFFKKKSSIKSPIHFKKRNVTASRKKNVFFRKSSGKMKRGVKSRIVKGKYLRLILSILLLLLSLFVVVGGGYSAVNFVLNLRNNIDEQELKAGFVNGFDDIPEYPGAQFIFENYTENEVIRNFLSSGNSVYRLPVGVKISDVNEYYALEMPKNGWEIVQDVPLESEEMKHGQFWIKDGIGVRIYSKLNDIWYQSISVKQAQSGLEDEVKKETERKLLLLTNEFQNLLPDFPWVLKIPTEYLIEYAGTSLTDLQSASFKKIGSSQSVLLEPLGYVGAVSFDAYLDKFLKEYNKKAKDTWSVINSAVIYINDSESIHGTVTNGSKVGQAVVLGNVRNNIVYVIFTTQETDPLFDYIVDNIEPAKSSY